MSEHLSHTSASISLSLDSIRWNLLDSLLGGWLGLGCRYTEVPGNMSVLVEFMRHGEVFFSREVDECDYDECFEFHDLGRGAFSLTYDFSREIRTAFVSKYGHLVSLG